jgi:hypothetical protein
VSSLARSFKLLQHHDSSATNHAATVETFLTDQYKQSVDNLLPFWALSSSFGKIVADDIPIGIANAMPPVDALCQGHLDD